MVFLFLFFKVFEYTFFVIFSEVPLFLMIDLRWYFFLKLEIQIYW